MANKKQIGKIQLITGIILLVATIISSILIIKNVYADMLFIGVSDTVAAWSEVDEGINVTSAETRSLVKASVISVVVLQAQIFKGTTYLFGICSVILVVLSIMLILQGFANMSQK